jgi:hypothetical protein
MEDGEKHGDVKKARKLNMLALAPPLPLINIPGESVCIPAGSLNAKVSATVAAANYPSKIQPDALLEVVKALNKLAPSVLANIGAEYKLSDLAVGSVVEVFGVSARTTKHGTASMLHAAFKNEQGVRIESNLMVPTRVTDTPDELKCCAILIYLGMTPIAVDMNTAETQPSQKYLANRNTYHDFRRYQTGLTSKEECIRTAGELRKLSPSQIIKKVTISSLADFSAPTAFKYCDVEELLFGRKGEKAVTVRFLTYDKYGEVSGRCYVPKRYQEEAVKCAPGIMVFRGEKYNSNTSHNFYDITFMNATDAATSLASAKGVGQKNSKPATAAKTVQHSATGRTQTVSMTDLLSNMIDDDMDIVDLDAVDLSSQPIINYGYATQEPFLASISDTDE